MLALFFAGCSADPPDTGSAGVTLTVEAGYGDGAYAPGDTVYAWADLDPQAEWLATWESSPSVAFADPPDEWNQRLVLPSQDVTLTATLQPATETLVEEPLALPSGARDALAWLPGGERGLVLFFHGASYDHTQLRSNAGATLTHGLAAAGYAIVAMDSSLAASAGRGGWSEADLPAMTEVVAALRADGRIATDTPVVAMGMSSGGQFAHLVGLALPADAVVAFCAPGDPSTLAATSAPTAWFMAANDSTFPTGVADAEGYAADLDARGVRNHLVVHPATPLYDQRFERVDGVSAAQSAAIADELRAAGFVDAEDQWVVSGATVTASFPLAAFAELTDEQVTAVGAEVEIMAAEHELYDDYAPRVVEFLDSALP
jgi:hypothetical protein